MFTIECSLLCENLGLLGAVFFWLLRKMLKERRCMNKFVANSKRIFGNTVTFLLMLIRLGKWLRMFAEKFELEVTL